MGWSSWNHFNSRIGEQMIREQADAMLASGMYNAGYRYINVDDGYFGGRDADGNLLANAKFPSGMKVLTDHIHAKGLKAGIYTDGGWNTCCAIHANDSLGIGSGIYGHEAQDCRTFFTEWGFDFLKVDWCGGERMGLDDEAQYLKIYHAAKAIDPDIGFNICRWQFPGEWAINKADSWRMSYDIRAEFASVLEIIDRNAELYRYASAGHYNDMDMLQVGRGMSYEEDKTHFSMWCMLNSPLIAGNDLRHMSRQTIAILTNKEVIALNQDPGFVQARRVLTDGPVEVWVKPLGQERGEVAVALMNRSDQEVVHTLTADQVGLHTTSEVRDLWAHEELGPFGRDRSFTLAPHGIVVLRTR